MATSTAAPRARDVPWVTLALLVANLVVFLVDVRLGLGWIAADAERLVELGGNLAPLTLTGEPWRLVSSLFLHAGLLHLLPNMYMLLVIGPVTERHYGRTAFLGLYLATGLSGALLSAIWHGTHQVQTGFLFGGVLVPQYELRPVVSVGASGALMGIAAALLAAYLSSRWRDPVGQELSGLGSSVGQVIAINLVLGATASSVDQSAHLGGLLAGFLGGAAVMQLAAAPGLRRSLVALALCATVGLGEYGLAGVVHSEALDAYRQAREEGRRERQAELDKKARRAHLERLAEEDARAAPPPVSPDEAAGVVIELGARSAYGLALGAGGTRAYVTDDEANAILVVDLQRRVVEKVIKAPRSPRSARGDGCRHNTCRGEGARGLAVDRQERFAFVTSFVPDALSVVDLADGRLVASVPVGSFPREVVLAADEALAVVMNGVDNSYSLVDLEARRALTPPVVLQGGTAEGLPFGRPVSMWTTRDRQKAFVLDGVGPTVAGVDLTTRRRLPDIELGEVGPTRVLPIDDGSWLLDLDSVLATFDVGAKQRSVELASCGGSQWISDMALSPNGALLARAEGWGMVRLIKRVTGRTVGLYPAPEARRLQFTPDGSALLILSLQGRLTLLDLKKSIDFKKYVEERGEPYCWRD
jgi:membrane associated rhomboid family serine protease